MSHRTRDADRHGLGVLRLPADGARVPAGRPGDPAGRAPRLARPDRLGDGRGPARAGAASSTSSLGGASRLALAAGPVPSGHARRVAPRAVLGRAPRGGAVALALSLPADSRSATCSRTICSGSSCSRCSSRGRPSAARRSRPPAACRERAGGARRVSAALTADGSAPPEQSPALVSAPRARRARGDRRAAGARRSPRGTGARSASGRATRCTRCRVRAISPSDQPAYRPKFRTLPDGLPGRRAGRPKPVGARASSRVVAAAHRRSARGPVARDLSGGGRAPRWCRRRCGDSGRSGRRGRRGRMRGSRGDGARRLRTGRSPAFVVAARVAGRRAPPRRR